MASKEMKVMLMECSYLNLNSIVCKLHQQMELMLMECSYLNLKPMVCKLQVWLFSLLQYVVGQPIVLVVVCYLVFFSVILSVCFSLFCVVGLPIVHFLSKLQ